MSATAASIEALAQQIEALCSAAELMQDVVADGGEAAVSASRRLSLAVHEARRAIRGAQDSVAADLAGIVGFEVESPRGSSLFLERERAEQAAVAGGGVVFDLVRRVDLAGR